MTSTNARMVVRLQDHASLDMLLLERPLDPSSWIAVSRDSRGGRAQGEAALDAFLGGLPASARSKRVFIQHRMDDLGRHEFIDVTTLVSVLHKGGRAALLGQVPTMDEDQVKPLVASGQATTFVAMAVSDLHAPVRTPAQSSDDEQLCPPTSLQANYAVCDELTIGRTQRIMLSDESTLARGGPHMPPIFNFLTLIVNCHQDASADHSGKYRVGTARPDVIFQPVHKLYGSQPTLVVDTLHKMAEAMWGAQQSGSVAVHCLAGLHRAPAVVVCYQLYRHYALGHTHLSNNIMEIYARLRSVRPAVAPLGYIELIKLYEQHMIRLHGAGAGGR